VIPEALGVQYGFVCLRKMPDQSRLGKPLPHGSLAESPNGPVHGCDRNVCSRTEPLVSFRA
jgi:hypothetical protein